jgi:peptidoglycan hydrolase-like protein with peptidoglycan-binding domain
MKGTAVLFVGALLVAGSSATLFAQQQQQKPPDKPPTAQHASRAVDPGMHEMAAAPKAMLSRRHHWTAEEIKDAQTGLAAAKLYMGRIDGRYGSETRAAMREYQRVHDLPVTGTLSDSVLVLLRQQTQMQMMK